jgi:hypothetical protein
MNQIKIENQIVKILIHKVHKIIMPVDDGKASVALENYYSWTEEKKGIIKRPYCKVFEDDGDVKTEEDDGSFDNISEENIKWREDKSKQYRYCTIMHYTGFQHYNIEVRETLKEYYFSKKRTVSYHLTLDGSFKSNHFGGHNFGKFTFADLQRQIDLVECVLGDASKIRIENLAPSLCPELPFPVLEFLDDSLISYRGEPFKQYDPDRRGKVIGYYCPQHQVDIKIYDKSLQLNLPNYFMQFEDRFSKMQRLKAYGIEYLSDLKDITKVQSLLEILLSTWDDILLFDNTINVNDIRLNARQRDLVAHGYSHKYWQRLRKTLTSSTYGNRLQEFRLLSKKYGGNHHNMIRQLIINEWDSLTKNWTNLPGVKKRNLDIITSSVGGNDIQLSNNNRYNKNNKEEMNQTSSTVNKSKKQIAKEKRDKTEQQFQSFLNSLGITLQKIEALPA